MCENHPENQKAPNPRLCAVSRILKAHAIVPRTSKNEAPYTGVSESSLQNRDPSTGYSQEPCTLREDENKGEYYKCAVPRIP
ncbi:hypothetical protein K458DRAFT_422492 [Lentithecium fluviatile CBS 122367]|uniref:Uncharacterized protein n=1 Tax=Lentithecium fluviatile CBS 122367 TaxID=1168545 RepID=A0A6G1IMF6_9PLEO|nr:hypothetical protein K458DRAFT_422492 [Lentithecium fluviatile CBS 122367]